MSDLFAMPYTILCAFSCSEFDVVNFNYLVKPQDRRTKLLSQTSPNLAVTVAALVTH